MDIMLYEQIKNLYQNYLQIKPVNDFYEFTYIGGVVNVTTRKDSGNHREVREGN